MMKKQSILLFVSILAIVSCTKIDLDQDSGPIQDKDKDSPLGAIDYNVGMKSAKYFANVISEKKVISIDPIISRDKDTIFFVVNYSDGWALLSGDKRATPIVAESENGKFSSQKENDGTLIWLNEMANEIIALKKNEDNEVGNENVEFWNKIQFSVIGSEIVKSNSKQPHNSVITKGPSAGPGLNHYLCGRLMSTNRVGVVKKNVGQRMQTKWGQGSAWNTNLPYVLSNGTWVKPPVGCTAVAMAQVLYYTHFKLGVPDGLYHNISSTGFIYDKSNYNTSFTRLDYVANSPRWNLMALYSYDGVMRTSYVADLMADVGNRVGMTYSPSGSGAWPSKSAMNSYGLDYTEMDFNSYNIIGQIRNGMPVMIVGFTDERVTGWWFWTDRRPGGDGHTWVIDGLVDTESTYEYVYQWELVTARDQSYRPAPGDPYYPYYGDLHMGYDKVLTIEQASRLGVTEDGDVSSERVTYTNTNFLMNWGWNGSYDNVEYASNLADYTASGYRFRYFMKIYTNIKRK